RFPEANDTIERSRKLREATGDRGLRLATTLRLAAMLRRYDGRYEEGRRLAEQALEIQGRLSPMHPSIAFTLRVMGDLDLLTGNAASARRTWNDALSLARQSLQPQHPLIAGLLYRLYLAANA